jgi:LDH2 family malate/lactate/ureidoglycolate dehydrogenase
MTTTETRRYGGPAIRIKPGNMDNVLADLWRDHKGANTETIVDLFDAILATDAETRRLAAEYIVTNRTRHVGRYAPSITPEEYLAKSAERVTAKITKAAAIKRATPEVFSFLNCVLPSGKLARHANAPELIEAGGIFTANGKKLHKEHGDKAKYGDVYDS